MGKRYTLNFHKSFYIYYKYLRHIGFDHIHTSLCLSKIKIRRYFDIRSLLWKRTFWFLLSFNTLIHQMSKSSYIFTHK